jgi:maltose alpha-D-glucosyltransferase/alpha-amylase
LDRSAGRELPPEVATQTRALLAAEQDLLGRIRATPPLNFSSSKIRIHGDYHLGQVLWAEGDFYIIDFEGEPARPIAQRREKQSPLKDVAGMLRSFSYAAYAGLFAHLSTRSAAVVEMEPWARIWQTSASASFLKGYFGTVEGAPFIPAEPSQRDLLLQLFMLDKALYELNYELNNRPDWVRIPLTAILGIVRGE